MKKLLSPILYPIFLIPTFIITLLFVSFSERVYGFIFPGTGEVESLIGITVAGGFLFLLANMIMRKMEGLERPTIADHFRQSSLWYVGVVLGILLAISIYPTQRGGIAYAELLIILIVGGFAILVNALYLYAVRKGVNKLINPYVKRYGKTICVTCIAVVVGILLFGFLKYIYVTDEQERERFPIQNKIHEIQSH